MMSPMFLVAVLTVGLSAGPEAAAAKAPPASAPEEGTLASFPLQHADCRAVCAAARNLFPHEPLTIDERTNVMVYYGSQRLLPDLERLVKTLDVPAAAGEAAQCSTLPVKHRPAEVLAGFLRQVIDERGSTVAADASGSTLLLRGSASYVRRAAQIVGELDRPPQGVVAEFLFLRAGGNTEPSGSSADAAAVGRLLPNLRNLSEAGRSSVRVQVNEKFVVDGEIAGRLVTHISGMVLRIGEDGRVSIRVEALVDMPATESKEQAATSAGRTPSFRLNTIISAARGEPVVLGSAPTGWEPGESLILVLRVQG